MQMQSKFWERYIVEKYINKKYANIRLTSL